MTVEAATEYWRSGAGLDHITPPSNRSPEGDGFGEVLRNLVGDDVVLDFGCGVGRLARHFDASRYVGVDICPQAVEAARNKCPEYRFELVTDAALPCSDVTLLHTVLLHIPNGEALASLVARIASRRVIVSEILGRHWRRGGNPPVFNRWASDYVEAFAPVYALKRVLLHPYPHYTSTSLSLMEFVRC